MRFVVHNRERNSREGKLKFCYISAFLISWDRGLYSEISGRFL